jgi:hypothetical protein
VAIGRAEDGVDDGVGVQYDKVVHAALLAARVAIEKVCILTDGTQGRRLAERGDDLHLGHTGRDRVRSLLCLQQYRSDQNDEYEWMAQ